MSSSWRRCALPCPHDPNKCCDTGQFRRCIVPSRSQSCAQFCQFCAVPQHRTDLCYGTGQFWVCSAFTIQHVLWHRSVLALQCAHDPTSAVTQVSSGAAVPSRSNQWCDTGQFWRCSAFTIQQVLWHRSVLALQCLHDPTSAVTQVSCGPAVPSRSDKCCDTGQFWRCSALTIQQVLWHRSVLAL